MKRTLWIVVIVLIAGCGSSSGTKSPRISHGPPARTGLYRAAVAYPLPACAHAGKAMAMPADFPASFPVPAGSRITGGYHELSGHVLNGFSPITAFNATLAAYLKALPRAGYTQRSTDAEPPREAQGQYLGHNYAVNWKLHNIPACKGVYTLQLYAQKVK